MNMLTPGRWIGGVKMVFPFTNTAMRIVCCLIVFSLTACQMPVEPVRGQITQAADDRTPNPEPSATLFPTTAVTPLPPDPLDPVATAAQPSPSPTAAPLLRQLTTGGCCTQPFWSPDSQRVLFLDRPSTEAASGFWSIGLEGGAPELFTDRLGIYSRDMQLLAYPEQGQTVVERLADGQRWIIPSGGRAISFSPDSRFVAWTEGPPGPPFDTPQRQVWISQFDGSEARAVFAVYGGGFAGWMPDGKILINGRLEQSEEAQTIWAFSLDSGEIFELAKGSRLRGLALSPDGGWLAYQVTFEMDAAGETSAENGLWLVNTQTGERSRLDLFGAYRWRDDHRLLIIPLDLSSTAHRIYQVDASSKEVQPITDPGVTPFKVANGDWTVSPDGKHIAFISTGDQNIWLLTLPAD